MFEPHYIGTSRRIFGRATNYEAPVGNEWDYKLRAGYLHSSYGYNLLAGDTSANASAQNLLYGGASLEFEKSFWGVEAGALAFNRRISLADDPAALTYSLGLRLGYLSAWYLSMGILNSDPIIGSRPAFNTGVGFALNEPSNATMEPGHVWLGIGYGPPFYNGKSSIFSFPYDALISGELEVPAFTNWRFTLRGSVDPNGQGGGYMSGGIGYRW